MHARADDIRATAELADALGSLHSDARVRATSEAAHLAPRTNRAPRSRPYDTRGDTAGWVRITLTIVVSALVLYVRHVSRSEARWSEKTFTRAADEARESLAELRQALARFHLEHHAWPGTSAATGELDGSTADAVASSLAPLLEAGVPANPWNGLATFRVLAPGSPWPASTDGRSGWIYRAETGELRVDVPAEIGTGGVRFYDL